LEDWEVQECEKTKRKRGERKRERETKTEGHRELKRGKLE